MPTATEWQALLAAFDRRGESHEHGQVTRRELDDGRSALECSRCGVFHVAPPEELDRLLAEVARRSRRPAS